LLGDDEKITGAVGSSYYVAPEVLTNKKCKTLVSFGCERVLMIVVSADDSKCDIWSVGVIAYMLLSGAPPFDGASDSEIFRNVKRGNWSFNSTFDGISREAKSFIEKCLVVDPEKRIAAKDAIKHPWFKMLALAQTTMNVTENVVDRILDFGNKNKVTKLFMEVMAYTMQPDQVEDIKKQFIKMDVSKSGQI
jgi:calcium-dependent protein kinase